MTSEARSWESNWTFKFLFSDYKLDYYYFSPKEKLSDSEFTQIVDWLETNATGRWHIAYHEQLNGVSIQSIRFSREEDLLACKLTWD